MSGDVIKGGMGARLAQPFLEAWRYRELIRVIVGRDLAVRFTASLLGPAWAVISPLVLLAVYTFAFSGILGPQGASTGNRALSIFVALVFFNLMAELAGRAPLLIQEHMHFIKRTIFPSASLAWIAVVRALAYAGIAMALCLTFTLFIQGLPWTVLLLPLIVLPYVLFLLGLVWFLAALGAFTRDLAYLMVTIIPILIFVTPVFYSVADLPEATRWISYLNPSAGFIEMGRDIILRGRLFNPATWLIASLGSLLVFYGGYSVFQRDRRILVDVI